MDSGFNRIISFILGLVVVVVFLAIITGRFNIRGISFLSKKPSLTPTPTSTTTPTQTITPISSITIKPTTPVNRFQTKTPGAIPSTGLPTEVLPLLLSGLAAGVYLKKIGRKV